MGHAPPQDGGGGAGLHRAQAPFRRGMGGLGPAASMAAGPGGGGFSRGVDLSAVATGGATVTRVSVGNAGAGAAVSVWED